MRIDRIVLVNWKCFRGEQSIDLDALVYGIHATYAGDPDRSNASGKTTLLQAVRFAVTGDHGEERKDDWISHGEAEGAVRIALSGGVVIERSRARGKSDVLSLHDGARHLRGDVAQARIYELIGFGEKDLVATCFFEQGRIAKFISTTAAERTSVVDAWLQLEALERAVDRAGKQVRAQVREMNSYALVPTLTEGEVAALEVLVGEVSARADAIAAEVEALEREAALDAKLARRVEVETLLRQATEAEEQVETKLLTLSAADPNVVETAVAKESKARAAFEHASKEHRRLVILAGGSFDGVCPVNAGKCPITTEIASQKRRNAKLASEAETIANHRLADSRAAVSERQAAQTMLDHRRATERVRDTLRKQRCTLEDELAQLPAGEPSDTIATRLLDGRERARQVLTELGAVRERLRAGREARARSVEYREKFRASSARVATWRETHAVLTTAHRQLAEGALAKIESGANGALSAAGVDARVQVRWAREGTGVASTCAVCGAPFPRSERVKVCEECGAARGANLVRRLDVVLTRRSGAMLDLAGAALQLSASAWLRQRRSAAWSFAALDEPLAQCDRAHRRSVSAHLAAMLRGRYGFEQAFVVSHDQASLEALPGRIHIECDGTWSTVRVVT